MTIVLTLMGYGTLCAQDHSVSPAFPIGAGERMIVIAGATIKGALYLDGNPDELSALLTLVEYYQFEKYQLILPVGSTIKRFVVQAADEATDSRAYVHIRLYRSRNDTSDSRYDITLRSVNTANLDSTSLSDFKQLVSNSIDHVVLQGWTYWIDFQRGDSASAEKTYVSNVKIIYEP